VVGVSGPAPVRKTQGSRRLPEAARGIVELGLLVARLAPKPDVAAAVRKLAAPKAAAAPTELPLGPEAACAAPVRPPTKATRAKVAPLAPGRFKVQFTVDESRARRSRARGLCFGPWRGPPTVRETAPPYGALVGGRRGAFPFRNGTAAGP